ATDASQTSRKQLRMTHNKPRRNPRRNLRTKTRDGHRPKMPEHKRSHKTPRDKMRHRECPAIRSSHRNPRTRPEGSRLPGRPGPPARSPLQNTRLLATTESHGITTPSSRDHYQRQTQNRTRQIRESQTTQPHTTTRHSP